MKRRAALALLTAVAALALAPHGCARRTVAPRTPASPPPAAATAPAPPAPEPVTAPAERAAPQVAEPAPAAARGRPTERVRIGLLTDLESVTLPCCDGEVTAEMAGERLEIVSPVTVRPAAHADSPTVWRLQAAAIRDERPAAELARRLATRTGERADSRFDAKIGLYRVRVGSWPTRAQAESASRRLRSVGLDGAWVVAEGGGISAPALEVVHRGQSRRLAGRRFVVTAPAGGGLRVDGRRYRGAIEVFLNDRGRLNVVNELPVEEYLRGVVPRELGPGQYPELAALKAQAVAARSYTLRNVGGFLDEGYDLCGTPQCQVYGGMDDEHPLSDRAIAETAGEILVSDGQPADALYSATCGGHTEDVEVVFPLRSASYLRGVPCIEAGGTRLAGAGGAWPEAVFGAAARDFEATPAALERALRDVVARAGIPAPADVLGSLERREVQRFLASLLDLAADARLFVREDELAALMTNPPRDWSAEDLRFAAWLAKSGLLAGAGHAAAVSAAEALELALRVALFLRVVEQRSVAFSALRDGRLVVRENGAERSYALSPAASTFRQEGGRTVAGDLLLVPGDGLDLLFAGGRLAGVVQELDRRGAGLDRAHGKSSWTRFRSDRELAEMVRARYPGFQLRSFEVLSRGVSGRVGRLRLLGADGEAIELEGLAIRWTFDLPDTRFTARHLAPEGGPPGWQFTGSGWGHGVGMCQTGAVGMARRGYDHRAILEHYYTGIRIERAADGVAH